VIKEEASLTKTALLPPVTAVRMTWALTGKFSNDPSSVSMALYAEDTLKRIEDDALAQGANAKEKSYIISATATMKASLRSLDTAYKGRDLNFKENEKLREAYLESVKDSLSFGTKAQDFLKSLPTMTIVGAGGSVTVTQALNITDSRLVWAIGLVFVALGYLINLLFERLSRSRKQMLYVSQDYERNLYYDQYVTRISNILRGLFTDLERIHKQVFGEYYESADPTFLDNSTREIMTGVRSTFCPYVHKHMRNKVITPELWADCESGHSDAIRMCPYWEGEK
jgi:hypothetical protein